MHALHHLSRHGRRRLAAAMALLGGALSLTAAGDVRPAEAVGGLCNGLPASSPQLDASGQKGYARLQGTPGDDVIIGGDGYTSISGNGGNDMMCAGDGYMFVSQNGGDASVRFGAGGGDFSGMEGNFTVAGGSGRFGVTVISPKAAYLYNGSPDNEGARFVHHGGGGVVKMDGGPKGALCMFEGGDELHNCSEGAPPAGGAPSAPDSSAGPPGDGSAGRRDSAARPENPAVAPDGPSTSRPDGDGGGPDAAGNPTSPAEVGQRPAGGDETAQPDAAGTGPEPARAGQGGSRARPGATGAERGGAGESAPTESSDAVDSTTTSALDPTPTPQPGLELPSDSDRSATPAAGAPPDATQFDAVGPSLDEASHPGGQRTNKPAPWATSLPFGAVIILTAAWLWLSRSATRRVRGSFPAPGRNVSR